MKSLFHGLSSRRLLLVLCVSGCSASLTAAQAQFAETIYLHGRILTGDSLSPVRGWSAKTKHADAPILVEALAVSAGKVTAMGSDADVAAHYRGPATAVVDLHGAFVMPGFNDAHVHLAGAGHIKLSVDLIGTRSLAEMQARIGRAAHGAAAGAWLTGGGWDHTLWPGRQLPTRLDLDAVSAGHPVLLERIDGHIAVVNSAALTLAGVTAQTKDPAGGRFDRDAAGEATGIVREAPALALIESHIPPPSVEDRRRGLELALADAAAHGLTSVQDNSEREDFLVLQSLEHEGKLPIRVSEWLPFDAPLSALEAMRASQPTDDRMLRTTMLKGFLDGSLGSRTAALRAPYADDPANSGLPRYDQAKLDTMTAERMAAGFQIGFHAIGDRAVDMALDAFRGAESASSQANGTGREPRFRIEHSQVIAPGVAARYKQLGVIASMQPSHILTDMHWAPARLGNDRTKYAYAWKAFLEAGVVVAFGTDYPVEPVTPFRGLYAAVTRRDEQNTISFHPEDVLTIGDALLAYTQGSAYAEYTETWKGILAPGYAADFVVLDRDLLTAAPADILQTTVLDTYVGGRLVYAAAAH